MGGSVSARWGRDAYLAAAAGVTAVAFFLGLIAHLGNLVLDRITFLGSALMGASWLFTVGGLVLHGVGFAWIAAAFLGKGDIRRIRLGRGALFLAGGYGLLAVSGLLMHVSQHRLLDLPLPDGFVIGVAMEVVAYLAALVAALLVVSAFQKPGDAMTIEAAARNRRLGWASVAFGVQFVLLILSDVVTAPIIFDNGFVDLVGGESLVDLAAIAAAVVAAVGFFGAERGYRLGSSDPLPRREGMLATAAALYLVYRAVDLANLRGFASWPWRLAVVAFAVAALFAVVGFVASRRSFVDVEDPLPRVPRARERRP